MEALKSILYEFSPVSVLIRLALAAIVGGLIGMERGRHGRAAGLRTHILICIGAAITSLTGLYLREISDISADVFRLSAQVISGIGFLGAGTILVRNSTVITGLTTAAGMWATAAIGVAVGYGFYSGALIALLICLFSVTVLSRLERKRKSVTNIYIELSNIKDIETAVAMIRKDCNKLISYDIVPPKSSHADNVGITLSTGIGCDISALKEEVCEACNVAIFAIDINS